MLKEGEGGVIVHYWVAYKPVSMNYEGFEKIFAWRGIVTGG